MPMAAASSLAIDGGRDPWLPAVWSVAIAVMFGARAIWRYRRFVAR